MPYASNTGDPGRTCGRESSRYWQPRYTPRDMTLDEAIEGFRHHLNESIRIRLRADVPLAFCLSGGVDSGAIASIAAKVFNYDVTTFSISDEDERYNEFENIRATVDDLGCRHHIINIPREEHAASARTNWSRYHDAPVYTLTYCIHSCLSELISRQRLSRRRFGHGRRRTGHRLLRPLQPAPVRGPQPSGLRDLDAGLARRPRAVSSATRT